MGALSAGELAGERIFTAIENADQEDEHSCFSDNTIVDVIGNAVGVRDAYATISPVIAEVAPELDAALTAELAATVAQAQALPGPFDQMILAENTAGREQLNTLVSALQTQGDSIAELGGELGYTVSLALE
jgi:putative iron-regulated protein